jgi:phosphatidylglycerophosphate synthase
MGLESLKNVETDDVATLPNGLSVFRGVGGVALGVGLAIGMDPTFAAASVLALAMSDAEGSLISATNRFPRLQKLLHIYPSKIGRYLDVVTDKMFGLSVLAGGAIGGQIPIWQAADILTIEVATSTASIIAKMRHADPETSKIGKIGTVARFAVMATDLIAAAMSPHTGLPREILQDGSDGLAVTAITLGALSCSQFVKQAIIGKPNTVDDSTI